MKKFGLFLVALACVSFFAIGCEPEKVKPTTPAAGGAKDKGGATTPAPATPAPADKK